METGQISAVVRLRDASDQTLELAELARRNQAQNLIKEIKGILFEVAFLLGEAEAIRMWREGRKASTLAAPTEAFLTGEPKLR